MGGWTHAPDVEAAGFDVATAGVDREPGGVDVATGGSDVAPVRLDVVSRCFDDETDGAHVLVRRLNHRSNRCTHPSRRLPHAPFC